MALDGIFLHLLTKELRCLADGRVEKLHQPSREELVLHVRTRQGTRRLLLSARADAPRLHLVERAPENPAVPPMLCMLFRKHLTGARLTGITQNGLDRVAALHFEGRNEMGDVTRPRLMVELMGRHSNLILVDGDGAVIDAVKRVDAATSSVRQVLPGQRYALPPSQDKENLLEADADALAKRIVRQDMKLSKAVQSVLQGMSPLLCREVADRAAGEDIPAQQAEAARLAEGLRWLKDLICKGGSPVMLLDGDGMPKEFACIPIAQYGDLMHLRGFDGYSALLDAYYYERENTQRLRQRAHDLIKQIQVLADRASRKAAAQEEQLAACADKETLKYYGDLIQANLHQLEKGMPYYDLPDYYAAGMPVVRVAADVRLSPVQNAQKYYKEYRKLQTAESMLRDFIAESRAEAAYLESVLDALSRCTTHGEITAIREELAGQGYLKRQAQKGRQKQPKALPPHEFLSSDGFVIQAGRNNLQNDALTLRQAAKDDIWFHTKEIPGSHVILRADGREVSDTAIYEAALLAAHYSKGAGGSNVPVDYTQVRNVRKPSGAKPGRVIYEHYRTVYVTPSPEAVEPLEERREET